MGFPVPTKPYQMAGRSVLHPQRAWFGKSTTASSVFPHVGVSRSIKIAFTQRLLTGAPCGSAVMIAPRLLSKVLASGKTSWVKSAQRPACPKTDQAKPWR